MEPHPIRMVVDDDLRRSRLTVFFRLLLAVPHFVWIVLWGILVFLAAILSWFVVLVSGRLPEAFHRFQSAYVRYWTHLLAFLYLAANPFPGFVGRAGSYPVDLEIDAPVRQSRVKTAFRILLALPALVLATLLAGYGVPLPGGGSWSEEGGLSAVDIAWVATPVPSVGFVAVVVAMLAWFVALVLGRNAQGFRDLVAYGLRYGAQVGGYLLFLTDRYPSSDTAQPRAAQAPPRKPVRLTVEDDLRRSRLTVFFRLLLFLPHYVWLSLWGLAAAFAVLASWFATLARGRSPEALHRFLAAYLRYQAHAYSYLFLVANPFPGFTGAAGNYPVDVEIDPPARQNRWITGFRLVLVVPAVVVAWVLTYVLYLVGVYLWVVGLLLGRSPEGLRNLGAFIVRYWAQVYAYLYLLTDSYSYSGPSEYARPVPAFDPEGLPAWPGPLRPQSLSS
jgi:Domain of unknown function (DUF4389)